ncbi:hypothetical protein HCJ32_10430 [Listeria booriae]|uniref:hypothetical protein n=1 Tax=Listeria booriae TaxID=1552123 RepID=UPI00162AC3F5|nr:hypothetical protein [Listeria booriae]MBC1945382.1 hypothetical protein [Listeria booriae]
MKKVISIMIITIFSVLGASGFASQSVDAASTHNGVGMHNGMLKAEFSLTYGEWSSAARYTGTKPGNLPRIAIQTRIERKDGVVKTYWVEAKDYHVKYDGGSNTVGANGNNYARAYGYYSNGTDTRVATKWM